MADWSLCTCVFSRSSVPFQCQYKNFCEQKGYNISYVQ